MPRITEEATIKETLFAMSEGNPGALNTMLSFAQDGMLQVIVALDNHQIYGEKIWVLWKYFSDFDPIKFLTLLDAATLEVSGITAETLHEAIDEFLQSGGQEKEDFDFDSLKEEVLKASIG